MNLADDIVQSILTPGYTANGVIKLMFYAFYMLFATLAIMVVMTGGNLHVVALLLLSVCLFLTIRWFMAEMDRIKKQSPPPTTEEQQSSTKETKKNE